MILLYMALQFWCFSAEEDKSVSEIRTQIEIFVILAPAIVFIT